MSSSTNDSRPLHVYRVPMYPKRTRKNDNRITIPQVRSPSPEPKVIVARRRASTPPSSSVRIVEVQSPESTTYVKRIYPQKRTTRIIRERSPLSTSSDSTSTSSSSPAPTLTIVPRREQVVRIATTSTSASTYSDRVAPIARRTRRAFVETPVAIVSETPLVNRGTSPKKQWKKREKPIPLDLDRDVYVSDEDYYEEAFADGTYKPKSYKFCKWCHGKCARRCPQCNFCEWYYSCPCCCWLLCLLSALAFLIGIFVLVGFLPEANSARRPIDNKEVNTTIHAIQQNLPCDPLTTYNASSTLVRCIDTTPVYIFTVVGQIYSDASKMIHGYAQSYMFKLILFSIVPLVYEWFE